MRPVLILATLLFLLLNSCKVVLKTAKQGLTDGYYTQIENKKTERVYVDIVEDTIKIYNTIQQGKKPIVDTTQPYRPYLPTLQTSSDILFSLYKKGFDVDFLTIPLKYRFAASSVQPQLNYNLNGAVYLGYRTDQYTTLYKLNPLRISKRQITHLGYSIGFFTGLGNTFMSPTNTNNKLTQEYDGLVWNKGIAAMFGINNFTVGVSLGFDRLLDDNRDIWIYDNKPWIGLAFGFNLN